jgi:hypothetical protein
MNALVSRRSVMVGGVAAGGVIALGGSLAYLRQPAAGYGVLAAKEIDIVESIAAVLFPAGHFAVHGGDGGTAPVVDQLLQVAVDPMAVAPFRYLLRAIEWGTFVSRGERFTDLDPVTAREVLTVWGQANPFPRRIAFTSLQALMGMAFFRRPKVAKAVGWRAGCFG